MRIHCCSWEGVWPKQRPHIQPHVTTPILLPAHKRLDHPDRHVQVPFTDSRQARLAGWSPRDVPALSLHLITPNLGRVSIIPWVFPHGGLIQDHLNLLALSHRSQPLYVHPPGFHNLVMPDEGFYPKRPQHVIKKCSHHSSMKCIPNGCTALVLQLLPFFF